MQAVILAAGLGKRLKGRTADTPKCLVPVNGKPMLVNALELLESRGINKVVLVVGYLKEKVQQAIGHRFGNISITYIENNGYDRTNNVYSLWLARDTLDQPTILLECDLCFDGHVIDRVLEGRQECKVLVSPCKPFMSGTVVTIGPDGVIDRLIPASEQHPGFDFSDKYKTVNIYYFSEEFLRHYFVPNLELYVKTQGASSYYELVLGALIYLRNPKIYATVVERLKWFEIDDETDLRRAEYGFATPEERLGIVSPLHGGYWRYDFTDFCYLFNLYFPNEELFDELGAVLKVVAQNYPSGMEVITEAMGRAMNLPSRQLVVGNGAAELIRLLAVNYIEKVTIPIPTFNEYENLLTKEQINYYDTRVHDFHIEASSFIDSVKRSGSNAAIIINPNNPTSLLRPRPVIEEILDGLRGIDLIVVDESFLDFAGRCRTDASVEGLLQQYPNLVLVRSISKEFGVPGLRLGYLASADQQFVANMRKYCPVWNINGIAEAFLEFFPRYRTAYEQSCELVARDSQALYHQLCEVPYLDPYPPSANFVFAKVDEHAMTAAQLREDLFVNHNLLIKDCSNKTGLEKGNYVRISARKLSDNDKLVAALMERTAPMGVS